MRNAYRSYSENLKGSDDLRDLGVDGFIVGCCGHGNELPCFIKGGEFLDCLSDC
jgi:hypothetical protein